MNIQTHIYTHIFFSLNDYLHYIFIKICAKHTPRLECLFTPPPPSSGQRCCAAAWPLLTLLTLPLPKYRERTWKSYYVTGFLCTAGIVDLTRNKIVMIHIISYSSTFLNVPLCQLYTYYIPLCSRQLPAKAMNTPTED